jgi:caspase 6
VALILSVEKDRQGGKEDCDNLEKALASLSFLVKILRDPSAEEIKKAVGAAASSNHDNSDCFVCITMSHGDEEGNMHAADEKKLSLLNDIFMPIVSAKALEGTPKVFIFNCCRGSRDIQTDGPRQVQVDRAVELKDAPPIVPPIDEADVLLAYSTLQGNVSNRDPLLGSFFICALVKVLKEDHDKEHVHDMLSKAQRVANEELAQYHKKQLGEVVTRGFCKKLFWKKLENV